jgi:hypothetical protein
MDDPLPFPPPLDKSVPGLCSRCGLLTDLEALNEHVSSSVWSRLSAVVERFLSHNHPLPSETRKEIASSLEPNATLLEKVEEAVNRLSELLDGLKATRDSLADRVQRSRAVLHPLRVLPDECLSNIFSQCVTPIEDHDDNFLRIVPPRINPWAVTLVSRHWRDVAFDTPEIWSNIVIFFTEPIDQVAWEPSVLSALNLFLTRSATHPLNVFIYSAYHVPMNLHPLLQGAMAHCRRWKRLYVNVPAKTFTFLQQIYHNLPILEHVFIEYSAIDHSPLWQDSVQSAMEWDSFSLATDLRSICTSPMIIQDMFGYCPQFAHRIKKYRSIFSNPDELRDPPFPLTPFMHLRALRRLRNLEDWTALCLFDNGWLSAKDDVAFEEEGGTVVMDALRSIRVKETAPYLGAIAQVLDRMSVPSLAELTLEGDLDDSCISSVISFIDRSDCADKLKILTLIDTGDNRGARPLIPLLHKLPSLRELGLQYTSLPPPPPPPLPTQVNLMNDEVDLLSLPGEVLPKGLEILVLSDESGLDESILDGVRDARPGLKVMKVDKLEVR